MTITRAYPGKWYGALTAGGAESVAAVNGTLTCPDNYSVFGMTTNGTTPNAGDTLYEAALADPWTILDGTSNAGMLGRLPLAKVMQSAGGNIQAGDVRSDTQTGAAAGGTLDIAAENASTEIGTPGVGSTH